MQGEDKKSFFRGGSIECCHSSREIDLLLTDRINICDPERGENRGKEYEVYVDTERVAYSV
jgi:hypothetical protein